MKTYRTFLRDLERDLAEGVRECENMQLHHMEDGTEGWSHYQRMLTWLYEVQERRAWYDNAKARAPASW